MTKLVSLFPLVAIILFIISLCLITNINCDKSTRPNPCWTSVDTLFSSGITIHDTSDVRKAFEEYVAYVDTTPVEYPNDYSWSYVTSRPFHLWKGRFYWQVDHYVYSTRDQEWILRRLVYVDENGVVVLPYGCI